MSSSVSVRPYLVAFQSSMNDCLASDSCKQLGAVSAKIHCSFLTGRLVIEDAHRYSIGTVIVRTEQSDNLLKKVACEFQKIIARKDIPNECSETHWDLFLKTADHKILWFRRDGYRDDCNAYRCDQTEAYTANVFLDHYQQLARMLGSQNRGREVISVIDEKQEFVNTSGMKVQLLGGHEVKKIHSEDSDTEPESSSIEKPSKVHHKTVEQLSEKELEIIEDRMRPNRWSEVGFITNEQSLLEVSNADVHTLEEYKVTFEQMADRITSIINQYAQGASIIEEKFKVEEETSRGFQPCPFNMAPNAHATDCGKEEGSRVYTITNIKTGKQLIVASLMDHLMRDHHFLQGGPYRIDPKKAIPFLGLKKRKR